LENCLIQGIMFSDGDEINPEDVGLSNSPGTARAPLGKLAGLPYKAAKNRVLNQFNHTFIGDLLKKHQGNITQAARACGLERQALQQIMRRYDITADKYRNQS
jgi:DNA-binding NtrC family response regulator